MFRQEMRHNFRTDGHAFFKLGAEVASTKYHILKNDTMTMLKTKGQGHYRGQHIAIGLCLTPWLIAEE